MCTETPTYTCIGKGGEYELLGEAKPAGELRELLNPGVEMKIYRDVHTQQIYVRFSDCFDKRMELTGLSL